VGSELIGRVDTARLTSILFVYAWKSNAHAGIAACAAWVQGGIIDDVVCTTPPIRNHIVVCSPGAISVPILDRLLKVRAPHTRRAGVC
jgi:hypothetical protein